MLPAILAGAGAYVAYQGAGVVYQVYISPYVDIATVQSRHEANFNDPVQLPSPEMLIDAYRKGVIGLNSLQHWMKNHGCDVGLDQMGSNRQRLWHKIVTWTETPAPTAIMVSQYHRGIIGEAELRRHLSLAGYGVRETQEKITFPHAPLMISMLMDARNRGDVEEGMFIAQLNSLGYTREFEQQVIDKLRYQQPGFSDLISFAVKDVWLQDIVTRFEYDAEFPEIFQTMMERVGMGWKPSDMGIDVPPALDITWPRAYWRAHWQVISPTQAMQAIHWLRPSGPGEVVSRRPGVPAFTRDDFNLILKTADYPPIMRDWLYGLSFFPLTRVDIRRMYRLGVLTLDQVREAYRDLGYDAVNAQHLAEFTRQESLSTKSSRDRARLETIYRQSFEAGLITAGQFAAGLHLIRLPTPEQRQAFLALPAEQQEATALAVPETDFVIKVITAGKQLRIAKATVAAVRKSFLRQSITTEQAVTLLQQAGIESADVQRYINLWSLEGSLSQREATIGQITQWVKRGAISPSEAVQRLSRLNVPNRDINVILAIAAQDVQQQAAREMERLAASERQLRQAQAQQLKAMQAERNRIISSLNRSATRTNILKFLKRGFISVGEAYTAMRQRGVFPADAVVWIRDTLEGLTDEQEQEIATVQGQEEEETRLEPDTAGTGNGVSGENGLLSE